MVQKIKEQWQWYLILGIALVALGTLAIMFAFISTIFSVIYLGAFLVAGGVLELFRSHKGRHLDHLWLHILLGILYITAGIFIFMNPLANAIGLTLLLIIFFIISGIVSIVFAFRKETPHRFWMAISGALSILLGILVWMQWPASGLWVIGMFLGIDAIFRGWSWIFLALMVRKIDANGAERNYEDRQ